MSGISIGIYDPPRTGLIRQQLEHEAHDDDDVVEIDREALSGDGRIHERELRSPDDVERWLRDNNVDPEVAAFYAESVRAGHHVVVFYAEEDDDHFHRVARAMQEYESPDMQQALDRWLDGERDVFPDEREPEIATGELEERGAHMDEALRETVVDVDRVNGADESEFRSHFDRTLVASGERFEEHRAAYAFGYGYGREPRLRDFDYDHAEPMLRDRFEERYGRGTFARARRAIMHGWDVSRRGL